VKWKPLRIWDWRIKLVYVVVVYALGWSLARVVSLVVDDRGFVVTVFHIAAILFGARIFRGAGEPIDEPRPGWRMTSRPTMSRRLGKLAAVFAALGVVSIPLLYLAELVPRHYARPPLTPWDGIEGAISAAGLGVMAFLYLRSARRLGWREPAAPELASPTRLDN
jgi:hypothetical protein